MEREKEAEEKKKKKEQALNCTIGNYVVVTDEANDIFLDIKRQLEEEGHLSDRTACLKRLQDTELKKILYAKKIKDTEVKDVQSYLALKQKFEKEKQVKRKCAA